MSSHPVEDDEQPVFDVECILAEKWQDSWDVEPFEAGIKYLTKWEGYPLSECKHPTIAPCTWEPAANFDPIPPEVDSEDPELPPAPTALELWNKKKSRMSRSDFRKLCDRNIAKWEASIETPGDDVETGPLRPENEGRDEDVVPPQSQQRNSRQQAPPLEVALAEREAVDSSQLNSLFIDSPGTTKANAELFVRQPPKARKPPIVQSDSSSASEGEVTDDSMMVEITTASEKTRRKSTGEGDSDSELQSTRKLARPSSTTLKRAATTPNPKTAAKPSPAKPARTTETRKSSPPQANSGSRAGQVKTILTQQSASTAGGPTSGASGTVTAKRSVSFATQPSSSKTISDTGKNSGIKIVNQPKIQPRQTFAQEATRHYKTLHGRAVAQKNSGREGTPDISALSFVNAPPGATVSIPRAPRDDPYGRREPSRRRSTETYTDDGSPGRQSRDANTRLEDWELDKVPLVCYSWRLSNSCPKSAKECRFMHRDKDEHGRDYRLGDMQGYIPAKYRKPPLTCPWWLNHRQGCKKSAEECEFAHKNTGWMKHLDHKVREVRIDPDKRPKSSIPEGHSEVQSTRRSLPPNQLTCWYWKHRKCRYSDQRCAFLHKDTDNVADEPPSTQQGPVSMTDETGDMGSVDMDIDDAVQPDVADEVTRSPSPIPVEQSQQHPLQPPPPPPPMELPPVEFTCEQLRTRINSVCKLDFEDMLSNDSEAVSNPVERRAFVMFHPRDHFVELDIITRWLLMHHVQVSSASYVGGWADFQQQVQKRGSGIIIVHPDVENFTDIPGFGQVLRRGVRLWSVGLQPGIEYDQASDVPPVLRYDRIEIFPVGGFIYITDEVFETKPQLALLIIKLFLAKAKKLKDLSGPSAQWSEIIENSLIWRLCVRPELMEHLFKYCEDQATELHAGDADVQSCAKLYTLLTNPNFIEQDNPEAPLSMKEDRYPIMSERRAFAECEPVDYFNTLARSQEAANLNMIRYYAALQVDMRRDYRHFYVIHTEPQAPYVTKWKNEIQTIAEVITPEQCIKEFRKAGQDGMFNFHEDVMAGDMDAKGAVKSGGEATTRTG